MASEEEAPVVVKMNDHEGNKAMQYPSNFIRTAKYTWLTFLPLNLFHQFKRVSNFYFLVNAVIAAIPNVAPIHPATSAMPLIFVLGVALIKDGYENYLRMKADAKANSIEAQVFRKKEGGGYELTKVESRDVEVGDIIKIELGEEVRADVILLSSTLAEGQAFIDTCNLDGETNLKSRKAAEGTWHLNSPEALLDAKVELKTGAPDPGLLHWAGVLTVDGKELALGLDQFLYRSCILRNTDSIYGMVAYAGVDTKMFRNLEERPPKSSNLDKKLNILIAGVLAAQLIMLILLASLSVAWEGNNDDHWYIKPYIDDQTGAELWGYRLMTYFVLKSYMIPISLFVTIEICKVAQAQLMKWDHGMFEWMHGKWVSCNPNSSDLNEQLSQVKFIFSDKTGTLTENVMKYKLGDIIGHPVNADNLEKSKAYLTSGDESTRLASQMYFRALAVCHTIQPFHDKTDPSVLNYEGSSPDEVALVEIAASHGMVLKARTTRTMTVEELGESVSFEILDTLEFTPDRKMMSMIVRDPRDGKIHLFTKGADSFVIPRMLDGEPNSSLLPKTNVALREMAQTGLRTLVVCHKDVSEADYASWHDRFVEAGKALTNRSEKVDEVCLQMELDMILIGATAIEDKLQDQVPETLKFFLAAKVVIWMLTGDKRETAVTIAGTSSLANPMEDYIDHIDIGEMLPNSKEAIDTVEQQLSVVEDHIAAGDRKVTFVIDGPALNIAMKQHFDKFLALSQNVSSAVCCRLTPLQKARVVKMFQEATGSTALAIGDGANDVSMIQEGRVGVGIVGLEGAQAALAADYAIPRFKHLKRLCCVHGRYALVRNALCILVSFYKNIMLSMTQFYYAFYTGYSGATLFDGWLLSFYNFAFTSLPPLFIGMFEKDIVEEAAEERPSLFAALGKGEYFGVRTIVLWFAESVSHSLILFYVARGTHARQDTGHRLLDDRMFGTIIVSSMIFLALSKMALHIRYWIVLEAVGLIFSAIFFLSFLLAYAAIPVLFGDASFYFTAYILLGDPKFWLYLILFVAGLLLPVDLAVIFLKKQLYPTLRDVAQDEMSR